MLNPMANPTDMPGQPPWGAPRGLPAPLMATLGFPTNALPTLTQTFPAARFIKDLERGSGLRIWT